MARAVYIGAMDEPKLETVYIFSSFTLKGLDIKSPLIQDCSAI